ncbi:MAG: ATP-binding protein [Nitrospirota bacterium]
MSLKKKIALSFVISASVIAILVSFEYLNFVEIRKEIRHLEITDTIRSKSLQLRRHEKNFFLFPDKAAEESKAIYQYLDEMSTLLSAILPVDRTGKLSHFKRLISEYRLRFNVIESSIRDLADALDSSPCRSRTFYPLIELTYREQPLRTAEFLRGLYSLPDDHRIITGLKVLDADINALRKTGEDILVYSKELDRVARVNVESTIHMSQIAIVVFFPLFFVTGIVTLFFIGKNVVNRLNLLIGVVEKTGEGHFAQVEVPSMKWGGDEVGVLIQKFNSMEQQLAQRDIELEKKNKELLQTKKLAAIGTLASGVAHELNNPLNNIYISAQVLEREASNKCSPEVLETLNDILGQTVRVKRIVGDLLEFARGKEPQMREMELNELVMGAYKLVSTTVDTEKINFTLSSDPEKVAIHADPEQMERVFINLFTNAVDAMSGAGELWVRIRQINNMIEIKISDTGRGMPAEAVEKMFEPFYTTKDKGTGLGLAIVFNIIKKHAGDITASSEEGKGTTFTIILPVNPYITGRREQA